jgi:hypothetical protein
MARVGSQRHREKKMSYLVVSMDLFRSEYGLQEAVGFIGCQDPSTNFFRFIADVIYYRP